MGSRFGGLKQVEPVGPGGELIIEYSAFDARKAGFDRVVFVIRREIERDFRAAVGRRLEGRMDVAYVYQELADLPVPHAPAAGRTKPWGTGQAVLAAARVVTRPFGVINADDFYGASAYRVLADHFNSVGAGRSKASYALVGYPLSQTLSEHGAVNRGVCRTDSTGRLLGIDEVLKIEPDADGGGRYPASGGGWGVLDANTTVSMTFFGFLPVFFNQLRQHFERFLEKSAGSTAAEFYLPVAVGEILQSGEAEVRLLLSRDSWFGMTYREDVSAAREALLKLVAEGAYPERLGEESRE